MEDEKVIQKYYPNSFKETDLLDYLKSYGLNEVVITGMMTHTCVDSTTHFMDQCIKQYNHNFGSNSMPYITITRILILRFRSIKTTINIKVSRYKL